MNPNYWFNFHIAVKIFTAISFHIVCSLLTFYEHYISNIIINFCPDKVHTDMLVVYNYSSMNFWPWCVQENIISV